MKRNIKNKQKVKELSYNLVKGQKTLYDTEEKHKFLKFSYV